MARYIHFKLLCFAVLIVSTYDAYTQNNCLDFDGSSDYVTMGDTLDMGTSDFTIESWILIEGVSSPNKIINKGSTIFGVPSNAGYSLRTSFNATNNIQFTVGDSTSQSKIAESTDGLTLNTWQHVAGVRQDTILRLYVNGVIVDSTSTPYVYNTNTDLPFALGALYRDGRERTIELTDGKIDEVRIWNVARSASEIFENMNLGLNGDEAGLLAYYKMDQGIPGGNNSSITSLMDNSSNSIDGELQSFALQGDNSNWVGSSVILTSTSINSTSNFSRLEVFPNPSHVSEAFTLRINNSFYKEAEISIIDYLGQTVKRIELDNLWGTNSTSISIENPGIYILIVEMKGIRMYDRIVVGR